MCVGRVVVFKTSLLPLGKLGENLMMLEHSSIAHAAMNSHLDDSTSESSNTHTLLWLTDENIISVRGTRYNINTSNGVLSVMHCFMYSLHVQGKCRASMIWGELPLCTYFKVHPQIARSEHP